MFILLEVIFGEKHWSKNKTWLVCRVLCSHSFFSFWIINHQLYWTILMPDLLFTKNKKQKNKNKSSKTVRALVLYNVPSICRFLYLIVCIKFAQLHCLYRLLWQATESWYVVIHGTLTLCDKVLTRDAKLFNRSLEEFILFPRTVISSLI